MGKKNVNRNLKYNRNEKRVNDTYAKSNKKDDLNQEPNGEDSTKYGEFISSFYEWVPIGEQKKKAKHLDDITK